MKNLTDPGVGRLESKVNGLRTLCILQLCLLIGFAVWSFPAARVKAQNSPEVLRTRGLVIEDNQGRRPHRTGCAISSRSGTQAARRNYGSYCLPGRNRQ